MKLTDEQRRLAGIRPTRMSLSEARETYSEVPWDFDTFAEGQKYSGMKDPYAGVSNTKYLDLGKVNPALAKKTNHGAVRRVLTWAMFLVMEHDVAFIRDPEGNLERFGLSNPAKFSRELHQEIEDFWDEQVSYAMEADDEKAVAKLRAKKKKAAKAKITLKPVQGKTGAGYKVTMSPVVT